MQHLRIFLHFCEDISDDLFLFVLGDEEKLGQERGKARLGGGEGLVITISVYSRQSTYLRPRKDVVEVILSK